MQEALRALLLAVRDRFDGRGWALETTAVARMTTMAGYIIDPQVLLLTLRGG